MNIKVGRFIEFMFEDFSSKEISYKKIKTMVKDICHDPLGYRPSKCSVMIEGESYGIPFNEVLNVYPAIGEQLMLNF